MNKLKNTIEKIGKMAPVTAPTKPISPEVGGSSMGHYRKMHKTGPELLVTRILMVNGPLTNKEIWRIYERMQAENRTKGVEEQTYWPSLTKLKETIKFMRINEKVTTNGYSYRDHIFKGWKIQEKKALSYVHPQVVKKIRAEIEKRDSL
jgi:hypothetical protein